MKIYEFNGKRILEFNGQLFIQLDPIDVAIATSDSMQMSDGKHKQPYVTRRKRGSGRLEPIDLAHIKEMLNAGYKAVEIAPKFGVTSAYVYNVKMHMKKNGELTLDTPPETSPGND